MLNMDKPILQDSARPVNSLAVLVRGQVVALDSTGAVAACLTATPVAYGLAAGDKNAFRDDTFGEYAAFGSGQLGVQKAGLATVSPTVFPTESGSSTLHVYDPGRTYAVNDKLYAALTGLPAGLMTNDATLAVNSEDSRGEAKNFVGRVVSPPVGGETGMTIDLKTL
jgi:hypothetical protein